MNCPYGTRRTNHVQMTDESADRVGAIRESPLRTIMLRISILVLCLTTLVGVIHVGAIHELPLPSPTLLLQDRHGNFLAEVSSDEARGHGYWPIDQLPPRVVAATLAIEDRRFWSHPGVDPLAIGRALWQNLHSDGIVSGASTLAMQLVRIQQPAERSYFNKLLEAATALNLTWRYGREGVLRHYLQRVPYGNNIHGIRYAARRYLDKPVEDLSWAEIAFLSAIPQSPSRMNPYNLSGRQRAIERGQRILTLLQNAGVVTVAEYQLATQQIETIEIPNRNWRAASALHAIVKLSEIVRQPAQQARYVHAPLITTTLDLDLQQRLTTLTDHKLQQWRTLGASNAAVIVLDLNDGGVLSWVGSGNYFDERYSGAIDYARIKRSSGSTLKPFIYALGLEQGDISAATVLDDLPISAPMLRNADMRYLGPLLPRQALANSRNIPVAQLEEMIGLESTYSYLGALGLHQHELPARYYGLGLGLGALPVTLEELVYAYTALANDGQTLPLRWFTASPPERGEQLLSSATARQITLFLADPAARLPSFPRVGTSEFPFPVAVKTGTSQGYRDAWVVNYSNRYLVAIWTGDADQQPMNQLGGAGSAAELAQEIMLLLHRNERHGQHDVSFPPPPGYVKINLCASSGQRASPQCERNYEEWLKPAQLPHESDQTLQQRVVDNRSGQLADDLTPLAYRQIRTVIDLPPRYAAWATQQGLHTLAMPQKTEFNPLVLQRDSDTRIELTILTPKEGSRYLRNPETPSAQTTIELNTQVTPTVPQVVWYLNNHPYQTVDYPYTTRLALTPGVHTIYAQVPFTEERSEVVRIEVE